MGRPPLISDDSIKIRPPEDVVYVPRSQNLSQTDTVPVIVLRQLDFALILNFREFLRTLSVTFIRS
jgi:hypothetical protein